MTKHTKKLRNILLKQVWADYKNMITMSELAQIFNLDLSTVYRLLVKKES